MTARARVERLLEAARRVADARDPLGRRARVELASVTGLSIAGVELAIGHCLEAHPSEAEVERLLESVPRAPAVHVLLSANVFVAALRAIALALAASARVTVRASRRDPVLPTLLAEAAEGLFDNVSELSPIPGEHVHAYGRSETLDQLRAALPRGTVLFAHGPGMGLAVVEPAAATHEGLHAELLEVARALALDTVLFDQRGCLSPRVVLVHGSLETAQTLGRLLADALSSLSRAVPHGAVPTADAEALARYRSLAVFAGTVHEASHGFVGVTETPGLPLVPPAGGRVLQVTATHELDAPLRLLAPSLTAIGISGSAELRARVSTLVPHARLTELGRMQRPPFDGPVDRRTPYAGELLA
jgi:hypothetical protein